MMEFLSCAAEKGGTALVFPAKCSENDMVYACKIMKERRYDKMLEREYRVLKKLAGSSFFPNAYKLSYVVLPGTSLDGRLMLTEEWVSGVALSRLFDLPKGFFLPRWFMAGITFRAFQAASILHDNELVYRDFHPGNLVLTTSGKLMIIDFGTALSFGTTDNVIVRNGFSAQGISTYTKATDVYNLAHGLASLYLGSNRCVRPSALPSTDLGQFFRHCMVDNVSDATQALELLRATVALPAERLFRYVAALVVRFLMIRERGLPSTRSR